MAYILDGNRCLKTCRTFFLLDFVKGTVLEAYSFNCKVSEFRFIYFFFYIDFVVSATF